ncbi:MAG: FtsX-like permease family protein, partial [Bryobacteraceae bacterium]
HWVAAGYFRTMAIPLIAGRTFSEKDTMGAPKTAIVNEAFVRKYAAGGNALGKRLAFSKGNNTKLDIEIVGVVQDNKHGSLREEVRQTVFLPYAQDENLSSLSFYIRTSSDEKAAASQVRSLVRSMDEALPVHEFRTMEAQVAGSVYTDRLVAALSSAFGLLATLLAAIGVYGVIAYSVARRTNEIGVRVALGAMRKDVIAMVMKEVALLSVTGIAAGAALALVGGRLIESQLYGVKPHDPLILLGAMIALGAVAMLAAFLPARRAARIEPIAALRYE